MDKENRLSNNASNIENFDDGEVTFRTEEEAIEGSDEDVKIYTPHKSEVSTPRHMDQDFGKKVVGAKSFAEKMEVLRKRIKSAFEKVTAVGEGERIVKDYGVETLGKNELLEYSRETCDDATFVDAENGIFAVFDGAGGVGKAGVAAKVAGMAANGMRDFVKSRAPKDSDDLEQILRSLSGRISREGEGGVTTAVVARIGVRDGKRVLDYAAAGDSRIYVIHHNGYVEQITRDEIVRKGYVDFLDNGLGYHNFRVEQKGEVKLDKGDMVLLCSDGITGNNEKNRMSNEEIARIFRGRSKSENRAKAITHALVRKAKKIDDQTAIVVDIK